MSVVLKDKLNKIAKVFDIDKLKTVKADKEYIQRYYLKNKIPYSIFHTRQNFVHMGISRDGVFKEFDLIEHATLVDKYVVCNSAKNVLELATGRGANSLWLAKKHPDINFHGIDISEGQISFVQKAAKKHPNFNTESGDFHNLEQFNDNTFDVVFIVEALCHSNSTERALKEVKRVLKSGGQFIVFDGYLGGRELSDDEKLAAKITEHGMAVDEFLKYEYFKNLALNNGFNVVEEENVSEFVVPTMKRFEKLAERFFKHPTLGKFVSWLLPKEFTYNAVSGMLMPVLFDGKVFEYWVTVFGNNK